MYTAYMGVVDYYATGEGRSIWIYARRAQSEENFKEQMQLACDIPGYFMQGVEINPERWIDKYQMEFDIIKEGAGGEFKYYLYFNFS